MTRIVYTKGALGALDPDNAYRFAADYVTAVEEEGVIVEQSDGSRVPEGWILTKADRPLADGRDAIVPVCDAFYAVLVGAR